jgi:hypothetical protein
MVRVVSTQCLISNSDKYSFPWGGQSLPYVLDFSSCVPESSVKLGIYSTFTNATADDVKNSSFANTNFTVSGDASSIVNTVEKGGVPQVTFFIKSTDQTTKKASGVGSLWFVWETSTNKDSFAI